MKKLTLTNEMIEASENEAVLVNYGDGVAMQMELVADYFIYFRVGDGQPLEDVDYSVDNVIGNDDCR